MGISYNFSTGLKIRFRKKEIEARLRRVLKITPISNINSNSKAIYTINIYILNITFIVYFIFNQIYLVFGE